MFGFNKNSASALKTPKRIVVASGCRACGVSFISELLAYGLCDFSSVSIVELGRSYFYDALGFESRFAARGFIDYFEKIRSSERIQCRAELSNNSFDKISWITRKSSDNAQLSSSQLYRLFYMPNEEFNIYDCSGLDNDICFDLLAEADYAVCVIDPLPTKLNESRLFLEKIRISFPDAKLFVNKFNPGVHSAELNHFLGTKRYFSIPSVSMDKIYRAEYNSLSFLSMTEEDENLVKTQHMLSKLFI